MVPQLGSNKPQSAWMLLLLWVWALQGPGGHGGGLVAMVGEKVFVSADTL